MADLKLNKVAKVYEDGYKAVKNIDLDIKDKEFIVLVGPSGCGKSTTLRMIAGLESISEGEMYIGNQLVNNVSAKDRDIAMVFQSYALYPHMNVRDNMAFAMKMQGVSKEARYQRVNEVAKVLQLEELMDKKPGALSGGQRQRVALGRAMVRNPKVFLLDEPLSNLDAKLRVTMRSEIVNLHRELETTFIYVTHDQTEAMTMGTRIAVMSVGNVEQFDTPANLYYNPANIFVAEFIGSPQMNMITGRLWKQPESIEFHSGDLRLALPEAIVKRLTAEPVGQEVVLGIRPENINFAGELEGPNVVEIVTKNVEQVGSDTFVYYDFEGATRINSARFNPPRHVPIGETIRVELEMENIHLFDKASEQSILSPRDVDGLAQ
ncbi:sugar ABC transporter ATP-binding protein [Suicoccus acidiformans]|uniref:Sugar ABC transporter ATP-binding protein n=1 Tax=Suicoccus acidiformans TaxID=2036206 RepID=A0A347WHQ3_9LACT|nr:ABC transporter ATP-binding protein [Suicoccus acidiformans]AXY24610.1 sugar ABC transporter ATP-binding protein [Suicoccus acidiformans]